MTAKCPAAVFLLLLCCGIAHTGVAATGQFLVTVLRSHDPGEVRALLGAAQPSAGAGTAGPGRNFRTTGYRQRRHERWQLVVTEGQAAFLTTTGITPQLAMPWVELTRHGPVPQFSLAGRERVHGIYVQAKRLGNEVELQLYQFTGPGDPGGLQGSGTGLGTIVRGRTGRWLDAGGNLLPEGVSALTHDYGVRHGDPQHSRLLVRVDALD